MTTVRAHLHSCCFFFLSLACLANAGDPKARKPKPALRASPPIRNPILGKSLNEMRKQRAKLTLSGQAAPPLQCASDKFVKKIVAGNPNALGCFATGAMDGSVKEILRLD